MNLSKTHRAYFEAAKSMAKLSDFKKCHVGAVAVCGHKIISSGYNQNKTNPVQKKLNAYRFTAESPACLHAEVSCLLPLMNRKDIDFGNVSLYVYREYQSGELAMAKPCASCSALIRSLGIKHVYYTGDQSYVYERNIY